MIQNKKTAVLIGVAVLVAGALSAYVMRDQLVPHLLSAAAGAKPERITLVIGPMFPISIEGRTVFALGTDTCPRQESAALRVWFRDRPGIGMPQCVVVAPGITKVSVSLLADGALGPTEQWSVERPPGYPERISFRRPDGSLVVFTAAGLSAMTQELTLGELDD